MGDIAGFSFYPGKNLGAYGEGGAVVTNRDDFARTVRMLRDWGQEKKGVHVLKAFNYRMEGFQGAVLGVKMNHIEAWTEGRRRAAAIYDRLLKDIPGIVPPRQMDYARHVYHVYGILVQNRDAVARKLQDVGIGTNVHYPNPIHLQPCFAELGHKRGDFPNAEAWYAGALSLPLWPGLTEAMQDRVVEQLASALGTAE